ncbi:S1C family serine protease [Calderihabitans maritimus]|uniref:Serine protease DegP n=1 Tax=Calderihabitans maritimus TaxID=1246530 RepID=A0A1Z5HNE2_9FIRM|nr:trypsin-like peptidase domain-containing protein [Calderihabitans maritimus]GAW90978.1 serine protease DegP [Calderihabitans maritimus]
MRSKIKWGFLFISIFIAGILLGGSLVFYHHDLVGIALAKDYPAEDNQSSLQPSGVVLSPPVGTSISDIVEKAGPAVVKIETVAKRQGHRSFNPFFDDPFFRDFFGFEFNFPVEPEIQQGLGSGFIISEDGYILTNEHVISGADEIKVFVTGYEKPFTAKLVGSDYELDLAVLKIEAEKKLPTLELGRSEDVRVGDWVIAIGNPYGLDHTVTVGVISAKGRPIKVQDRHYRDLLQTDASINPGNSGGPLLNLQGKVVGINTAINAQAQGIGFAIPSSTVQSVLDELIEKGRVVRPQLGVLVQPVTPELADYFGLKKAEGAVISWVVPGSPADKAGLQRGDVVLEYNKVPIKTPADLQTQVRKTKIGERVVLVIFRDGKTRYVTVTIEEDTRGRK